MDGKVIDVGVALVVDGKKTECFYSIGEGYLSLDEALNQLRKAIESKQ